MYSPPHVAEARYIPSEISLVTLWWFSTMWVVGSVTNQTCVLVMRELRWQSWMVGCSRWDHLIRNEGGWLDWKIHSDSNTLTLLALIYWHPNRVSGLRPERMCSQTFISILSYQPTKRRQSGHERPFLVLLPEGKPQSGHLCDALMHSKQQETAGLCCASLQVFTLIAHTSVNKWQARRLNSDAVMTSSFLSQ